jgi:hypothetical protein
MPYRLYYFNVFLKWCKSTTARYNAHYLCNIVYWISIKWLMGSYPGQANFFHFLHLTCYYFTLYNDSLYKFLYFLKICKHVILHVCIVSGAIIYPTSEFRWSAILVFFYYRLWESEKYDFSVHLNVIRFIPNFIQIRIAVLDLNHTDWQTHFRAWQDARESCKMSSLIICALHRILSGWWNHGWDWQGVKAHGEMRYAYRNLVDKCEGSVPVEIPKCGYK